MIYKASWLHFFPGYTRMSEGFPDEACGLFPEKMTFDWELYTIPFSNILLQNMVLKNNKYNVYMFKYRIEHIKSLVIK